MVQNLRLYHEARFYQADDATAKSVLKNLQQQVQTPSAQKNGTADHLRTLAAALASGLGWGLEMYAPNVRLLPGKPLVLKPPLSEQRPVLSILGDEEKSQMCAANFLKACGLRVHVCKDLLHRSDNNSNLADSRADLGSQSLTCLHWVAN